MNEQYSYSPDGEMFNGGFPTREAAIAEAHEECSPPFYTARCESPTQPETYFDIEWMFERVSETDDYCGEWADCWDRSTKGQRDEIEAEVKAAIGRWLDRHNLRPNFFVCRDIVNHD